MDNKEKGLHQTAMGIVTRDFMFAFLGLLAFIVNQHALYPTLPIYLKTLGSNTREIGVLVGILGVSALFSRLMAGASLRKYSERNVMMFGALVSVLTFLAFIVLRPFWPLFAVRFLQGIAFACIDTAALALVVRVTPLAHRGQAIGYFTLAPILSTALIPLGAMFLINQYSFNTLFLTCVGLSLCSFFFAWKLDGQETIKSSTVLPSRDAPFLNRRVIVPFCHDVPEEFCLWGPRSLPPLYAIQCGVRNPGWFFSLNGGNAYHMQDSGKGC